MISPVMSPAIWIFEYPNHGMTRINKNEIHEITNNEYPNILTILNR